MNQRGKYFKKRDKEGSVVLDFNQVRNELPNPLTERKDLLDLYWYAVELAFKNAKAPDGNASLVSAFQDSAFNDNLFLWDSAFITRFLSPFDDHLPGIRTLDNFYNMQLKDGLIPREFKKDTGEDFKPWVNHGKRPLHSVFHNHYEYRGLAPDNKYDRLYYPDLGRTVENPPYYTLDNLNHPILAYAEYYHYLHTGDVDRLWRVHEALFKHFKGMKYHLRHASDLYVTDWASMDNSPRNKHLFLGVDISSEMALFADMMIRIYNVLDELGFSERIEFFNKEKQVLKNRINHHMWHDADGFYYDLDKKMTPIPIKTIAGFWPMLAGITEPTMNKALMEHLKDDKTFNRLNRVPSLSADHPLFNPNGGYWSGAVWAPTNLMVTDGLERNGNTKLARTIALEYLDVVATVFNKTGTIWETYPADYATKGDSDRGEFVGWSGIGPALYLLQYHIGLRADATEDALIWTLDGVESTVGCERYRFLGRKADLQAIKNERQIEVIVNTEEGFNLKLIHGDYAKTHQIEGNTRLKVDIDG